MAEIVRHQTRDGGPIQVGMSYYLHARLHDPLERVELVGYRHSGPSWVDGQPTALWAVRDGRGEEFLCEAWQLSRVPADELYRQLRERCPGGRA